MMYYNCTRTQRLLHVVNMNCGYLFSVTVSYREIRECLRLDPDHKLCFPHYKVHIHTQVRIAIISTV